MSSPHQFLLASGSEMPTSFPGWNELLLYLTGIFIFLVLNAFFVAVEFALVKVRKSQVLEAQAKGARDSHLALRALSKLDGYLSAGQLGITVASLVLGMLGEPLVFKLVAPLLQETGWHPVVIRVISFIIAAASFSYIHVVVGEQVPKVLAIRKALPTTLWLIRPLHWFYWSFGWAIWIINGSAGWILRRFFKVDPTGHDEVHSAEELARLVEESEKHAEVTSTEREILINALELNELKVLDVMTPRSEVVVFDLEETFENNLSRAIETQHTRFPLVEGHLDRTLGMIHMKDLLVVSGDSEPDFREFRRDLPAVPGTMRLDALLTLFLRERSHLALVVNEFGDPMGVVFLDNVLEKLVGDIRDEFDAEPQQVTASDRDRVQVAGSLPLSELGAHVASLSLETAEATTIGGYLSSRLGRLPVVGDRVEAGGYQIEVTAADERRVKEVAFVREVESGDQDSA